jgi:esterase/lipase
MKKIFLPITLLFLISCSQTPQKVEWYKAGFKTIQAIDKSRIYKPNTDSTDYLHYKPLDIDIWYPATTSVSDSTVLFRDILGLFEKRANYYTASRAGDGLTQQVAQSLCDGFKCSDTGKLLNYTTKSFKNAAAVKTKFPLVIYLSAYNGMSYENFSLFECLASKGFVVVAISSIGRFPGDMTMKKEDLMEQVNDAIASVNKLREEPNIDFNRIGIIGYSWGGLAAAILASKIPKVACLMSLDGSEFHHYGELKEENADFDDIKNSNDFKNTQLAMPYLRLESQPQVESGKKDSVNNFSEKLVNQKLIYTIDSAKHEDFGCLSLVVKESGNCKGYLPYNTILKLAVSFFEQHLKHETAFSTPFGQEINKTIKKKSSQSHF